MQSQLAFMKRQLFITPKPADPKVTNLSGQCGIITGSNVGLGLEASKQVLGLGLSHLILAVRSLEKGEAAKRTMAAQYPNAEISVWDLDMSSYDLIQKFVKRCETLPRLDFAILNAGVATWSFVVNPETKHEECIQINSISTPLMAALLLPVVAEKAQPGPGKITIVGSETGEWAAFKEKKSDPIFPAFDNEKGWAQPERYYVSKLLPEFWVKEAAKRIDANKVILNIVNPGFCYGSALHRGVPGMLSCIFEGFKRAIGRTCEVGARPIVNAAVVAGKESHGQYCSDCHVDKMAPIVNDQKLTDRIYNEYEQEFEPFKVKEILQSLGKSG